MNQPAVHNINREHYEQLYLQLGQELLLQEIATKSENSVYSEMGSIIANTELIDQHDNNCLLMLYAYLSSVYS